MSKNKHKIKVLHPLLPAVVIMDKLFYDPSISMSEFKSMESRIPQIWTSLRNNSV